MQHKVNTLESIIERPIMKRKISSDGGSLHSGRVTISPEYEEESPKNTDHSNSFIDE